MRSEPGPSGGRPRWSRNTAPAARSASAAGLPSAALTPSKDSPAEWATMNQGGTPARAEGADHRARRGADDELGAARIPVGLLGEGVQAAGQPSAAEHSAGAEHQSDSHDRSP